MNAQFRVIFKVTIPGSDFRDCLFLASPDLANPRQATKRAVKTATVRMKKKMIKRFPHHANTLKVTPVDCMCVG